MGGPSLGEGRDEDYGTCRGAEDCRIVTERTGGMSVSNSEQLSGCGDAFSCEVQQVTATGDGVSARLCGDDGQ